ncbi:MULTISPECIES: HNH endonuclease [unclassified Microcoleus]|uniref:HNH endonuclease n=1 Tax=unclassified Microcoleus TaxID=2642155 RepID=UPI002FD2E853
MQDSHNINEVIFVERDTQIFNISDTKTRLSTLQNYFFPRLETLLRYTLDVVALVYDVNPYERMTFAYSPSHRDKAKENKDYGFVHIGIIAKRGEKPLKILKRNGQPFFHHPTYLTFKVFPSGTIHAELMPFRQGVDDAYVARISQLVAKYSEVLMPLLSVARISHTTYNPEFEVLPLHQAIVPDEVGSDAIRLISPKYYFPVRRGRGLYEIVIAFILLYALGESFICIGEGREPQLENRLEQFKEFYLDSRNPETDIETEETEEEDFDSSEMPELDSYSFVRAGKWWTVLARDKWKCLSCGRSAREDGVLLEVDHIIPRSKGGSDHMSNLQTLCKKCNIGKSNRDSTRLCVTSDELIDRM